MGAALPKPVCSIVLERYGSKDFRVGLAEMNGWRTSMEDAHVAHLGAGEGYFGILDGHGGGDCSAWCAQRLHEKLAADGCPTDDAAAKKLVLETDRLFLETGLTGGSTAAMCVIRTPTGSGGKYKVHVINAGDSRVLMSRADGTIIDGGGTDQGLSTDHKPDYPSERARIERCGGRVVEAAGGVHRVNGDLAVSRGFGDGDYKKTGGPRQEDRPVTCDPEMGHFECTATDFVIIACDGVSEGSFTNAEVCELAAKVLKETDGDAAKAAEAVINRAIETDSKDNISCMIILLGEAPTTIVGNSQAASAPTAVAQASALSRPITIGKHKDYFPGSLIGSSNSSFVKAYVVMCERGGVTFAEAVELRHKILLKRHNTPHAEAEDESELQLIGTPKGVEGSVERKQWFQEWADSCMDAKQGGDDDAMGGGRGSAQQMMMMRMLLDMMQKDGQADNAPAAGKGGSNGGRGRGAGRGGGRG